MPFVKLSLLSPSTNYPFLLFKLIYAEANPTLPSFTEENAAKMVSVILSAKVLGESLVFAAMKKMLVMCVAKRRMNRVSFIATDH